MRSRWLVALGCLGVVLLGWLIWAFEHTTPPAMAIEIAIVLAVVALAVGPWAALASRRLDKERETRRLFRRGLLISALIVVGGVVAALVLASDSETAGALAILSIFAAAAVTLVGAVILPWTFVLARTLTRERTARIRAEERAEIAAHLHDSVLQALTLIQKRAEDPELLRLARRTERELRAWLYGPQPAGGDDFAAAVREVADEVEDRYAVTVELITVGTCHLNGRARAVLGALREALTNAARHAQVRHVSVYAEAGEAEAFALIRDKGSGFDPSHSAAADRRGIADSIEGRMHQHGGSASVRSTLGQGTEVELRMPLTDGR